MVTPYFAGDDRQLAEFGHAPKPWRLTSIFTVIVDADRINRAITMTLLRSSAGSGRRLMPRSLCLGNGLEMGDPPP
jgi:hypothetical protein